jgi:hypothetical protein
VTTGFDAVEAIRAMMGFLREAGYWRDEDLSRDSTGLHATMQAFRRMAADASEHRNRPNAATGREVALAFLVETVTGAHRPMAERMGAAQTLLMHGEEGK